MSWLSWSDLPVRRKLMLIVFLASSGALLLANVALFASDVVRFRREMVSDLETLGEIISENMAAPLSFNDPVAANETLRTLGAKSPIAAAAIYDHSGRPFARYARDKQPGDDPRPRRGAGQPLRGRRLPPLLADPAQG